MEHEKKFGSDIDAALAFVAKLDKGKKYTRCLHSKRFSEKWNKNHTLLLSCKVHWSVTYSKRKRKARKKK